MSRAGGFLTKILQHLPTVKEPVFIDFGSVVTRVQVGNAVVFNEPTCINIHRQTGSVVAIGKRALQLWGKTPSPIQTVFPVQNGTIADQDAAEKYLKAILHTIFKKEELFIIRLNGLVSSNASVSPVDRQVLRDVFDAVGMSGVQTIPKSTAFFATLRAAIPESAASGISLCTVDIGGQTTEVGIFAGEQKIYSKTIPLGGISFTEKVKYKVRTEHQVAIGWATAESLKQQIGQVFWENAFSEVEDDGQKKSRNQKLVVRGKNVLDSTITTVTVSASDFAQEFAELMEELEEEIKISFAQAPADVVAEALSNGVYLTGGGSQLAGILEWLQQSLKCDVIAARDPQLGVVKGLAHAYRSNK